MLLDILIIVKWVSTNSLILCLKRWIGTHGCKHGEACLEYSDGFPERPLGSNTCETNPENWFDLIYPSLWLDK